MGARTHGLTHSSVYAAWRNMRRRCYEVNNKRYALYGARGIRVCDRWLSSFENFLMDMGVPTKGWTLDRIDNDKNYCKENCRWLPRASQSRNRRCNVWIDLKTRKEVLHIAVKEVGISEANVNYRRRIYGIHPQIAFEAALKKLRPLKYQEIYGC